MRTRRRWGRELSSRQRQLSLDLEMKWRLPGRGSGTGTYGRTLNLLSSDPCPAAVPHTLRAGRAPGTDRALSGCSSASPPPRLQLRPKGLHSFCLRRLEVFAQVCRQNSRLGSQRFPFRASQDAGNGGCGGLLLPPRRLRRLLLLLCPPEGRGVEAPLLSAPRPGQGPLTSAPRVAHIHVPGGSRITAASGAGPGGAARGAPETRGCKKVPRPELRGTTRLSWPWAPRSHILSPRRVFLF